MIVGFNFFVEHHGKGRVDGNFGVFAFWLKEWCLLHLVDSPQGVLDAGDAGAKAAIAANLYGLSYTNIFFVPGQKPKQRRRIERAVMYPERRISKTYCLRSCVALANPKKTYIHNAATLASQISRLPIMCFLLIGRKEP